LCDHTADIVKDSEAKTTASVTALDRTDETYAGRVWALLIDHHRPIHNHVGQTDIGQTSDRCIPLWIRSSVSVTRVRSHGMRCDALRCHASSRVTARIVRHHARLRAVTQRNTLHRMWN